MLPRAFAARGRRTGRRSGVARTVAKTDAPDRAKTVEGVHQAPAGRSPPSRGQFWLIVTGPWSVVHTVLVAPLASTAVPRMATGPTLTPQIVAAT